MKRRHVLAATPALLALPSRGLRAQPASPAQPIVVELFTSQSCSSCPPADAVLTEFVRDRPDLLPLSFHVTYWDRLGWRDRFSLQSAAERQRRYGSTLVETAFGPGQVYTPQIVVQGRRDAVGSDRGAVLSAIAAVSSNRVQVPVALAEQGGAASFLVGTGAGSGTIWLIGFDRYHVTEVRAGENGGRTLGYSNVVRGIASAGTWEGRVVRATAPKPDGERMALLLQGADGGILGAALAS
ncbi:DUF1223 domain-containing protein [Roseomonas hellenica]|uniref:DUF1223 domain-containing protein n=1 Tax=Plastoroseomonas hellenica TaxID=2687306 RepID=A0ABS5EWS5_9PROT|nr:DUF1223 domain-containing protein [Plastoroseomonas hellenica]MBR0664673.1 DUF1223 domain-containing protein [Plastoroseomonas hellenica]